MDSKDFEENFLSIKTTNISNLDVVQIAEKVVENNKEQANSKVKKIEVLNNNGKRKEPGLIEDEDSKDFEEISLNFKNLKINVQEPEV